MSFIARSLVPLPERERRAASALIIWSFLGSHSPTKTTQDFFKD